MASGTIGTSPSVKPVAPRTDHALPQYVRDYVRALWRAYWAHRAWRASVVLLSSLDDRTLADIGLPRGESEAVMRHRRRQRLRFGAPDGE
jgi:uncharacterized protein YjiS (DUF1127 family)